MDVREISVDTSRETFTDLTATVREFCRPLGDGLVNVFVPHATAGLALIETGAGTEEDLGTVLDRLLPHDRPWRHSHGSPGHGADHVLPAFLSASVMIPVDGGRPALGTWQHVVLIDTNRDNPQRTVRLTFIAG